jgi:biopolymer transport protein ExbD
LRKSAGDQPDPTIVINADAKAPHQSVINIMEAARIAGYGRITFTTQNQQNK